MKHNVVKNESIYQYEIFKDVKKNTQLFVCIK